MCVLNRWTYNVLSDYYYYITRNIIRYSGWTQILLYRQVFSDLHSTGDSVYSSCHLVVFTFASVNQWCGVIWGLGRVSCSGFAPYLWLPIVPMPVRLSPNKLGHVINTLRPVYRLKHKQGFEKIFKGSNLTLLEPHK